MLKANYTNNLDNLLHNKYDYAMKYNNTDNLEYTITLDEYNQEFIDNFLYKRKANTSSDNTNIDTIDYNNRVKKLDGSMSLNNTLIRFNLDENQDYLNKEFKYGLLLNTFASLQVLYSICLFVLIKISTANSKYVSFV